MEIHNGLSPSREQIQAFLASEDPRPVVMVNLLTFRERAAYADGRETDLTGEAAFAIYSGLMREIIERRGGCFRISTLLEGLVIGTGEMPWQRLALMEYPSRRAFAEIATSEEVRAAAVHRHAGLESQILIASTLQETGKGNEA